MSQNKKLKVAMQLVLAVSAAGVATVLHNAPAGAAPITEAGTYTAGTGANYGPSDFVQGADSDNVGTDRGVNTNNDANTGKNIVGTAKAQILAQITNASVVTLDFGKIVPSQMLGTITIDKDGVITNTGGARYVPETGAHRATLSFTGEKNQNITIDAAAAVTITNATGGSTMLVDLQYGAEPVDAAVGGTTTIAGIIDATTGNYSLNYGGTLKVAENQAAGIYSGTYDIFVTYVA